MSELSFEGRVAIVTGVGHSLGRAHALLLARRGAKVVVNDLAGSTAEPDTDAGLAHSVVAEIQAAGGVAVADTSDVSTQRGGATVVDTAVEAFGRLDILVNNAGSTRYGGLPGVDLDNLRRHLAVHLLGSFNTMWAAWPQFIEQGHGRVVLTTSRAVFGQDDNLSHAVAKAGIIGLARSARLAGEPHDIKVNLIAPVAHTRTVASHSDGEAGRNPLAAAMSPDMVSPMVAYLAHSSCPVSGELYAAGAGRFARVFLSSTDGYLHEGGAPTVEDVVRNWGAINRETGQYVPGDALSWSDRFLRHLSAFGASK